nr:MAG TPA: hypothetical protein [Caudoviricetes sp.]
MTVNSSSKAESPPSNRWAFSYMLFLLNISERY